MTRDISTSPSVIVTFVTQHRKTIIALAASLVILNARQLVNITQTKAQVLWTGKLSSAIKSLNVAVKANPWGIAAAAVATFIGLLADAASKTEENTEKLNGLDRAHRKASDDFDKERSHIEFLTRQVHNNNLSYEERKKMLEALRAVDLVIPEENWEQKRTDVHEYHIDTFVMGDDWEGKFDFLKEEGCEVVYLPRTPEISTTQIKKDLHDKK